MTVHTRKQLTLFVEQKDAGTIEQARQAFNPLQFELLKAHVTFCREDEIENLEPIISNLLLLIEPEFTIEFGSLTRFGNEKGAFLAGKGENIRLQQLRKKILSRINDNPKRIDPHITIMHPRNSVCTDPIFEQILKISFPAKLIFEKISLIEQYGSGPWKILQEFELLSS